MNFGFRKIINFRILKIQLFSNLPGLKRRSFKISFSTVFFLSWPDKWHNKSKTFTQQINHYQPLLIFLKIMLKISINATENFSAAMPYINPYKCNSFVRKWIMTSRRVKICSYLFIHDNDSGSHAGLSSRYTWVHHWFPVYMWICVFGNA